MLPTLGRQLVAACSTPTKLTASDGTHVSGPTQAGDEPHATEILRFIGTMPPAEETLPLHDWTGKGIGALLTIPSRDGFIRQRAGADSRMLWRTRSLDCG